MRHILYFVVMAAAMMLLARYVPGFHVDGWKDAFIAALVLALVNTIVKPILFVLTLPFTILTLGLFLVVLNLAMLALTAWLVPGLSITGVLPLVLASIGLAFIGMVWKMVSQGGK